MRNLFLALLITCFGSIVHAQQDSFDVCTVPSWSSELMSTSTNKTSFFVRCTRPSNSQLISWITTEDTATEVSAFEFERAKAVKLLLEKGYDFQGNGVYIKKNEVN